MKSQRRKSRQLCRKHRSTLDEAFEKMRILGRLLDWAVKVCHLIEYMIDRFLP